MPEQIIQAAALVSALAVLLTAVLRGIKFYLAQKQQDQEIMHMKNEMSVICYGVLACLDGLKQMGCNGNVTQAKNMLEKHLNKSAHE